MKFSELKTLYKKATKPKGISNIEYDNFAREIFNSFPSICEQVEALKAFSTHKEWCRWEGKECKCGYLKLVKELETNV